MVSRKAKEKAIQGHKGRASNGSHNIGKAGKTPASMNPFERHQNHRKHDVIGQRIRGESGSRSMARSRAIEQRKKTLLPELHTTGKTGEFVDRRFGEGDVSLSVEDKMMQRFAITKQKQHVRSSSSRLYNLNDDDDDDHDGNGGLTHMGQSLSEDVMRQAPAGALEEDEEDLAQLYDVGDHHFGGGLIAKKRTIDDDDDNSDENPKSKKEVMQEIIAKSKLAKLTRQRAKEKDEEEIDRLDSDLRGIWGLLSKKKTGEDNSKMDAATLAKLYLAPERLSGNTANVLGNNDGNDNMGYSDSYDVAVNTLRLDRRAAAKDRLPTAEESAMAEKLRLERLERERLRRMRGEHTKDDDSTTYTRKKIKSRDRQSADALDDDWDTEKQVKKSICYDSDGKLIMSDVQDSSEYQEDDVVTTDKNERSDGDEESENDDDDDDDDDKETVDGEASDAYSSDLEMEDKDIESDDDDDDDDEEEDEDEKIGVAANVTAEIPYTFAAPATLNEFKVYVDHLTSTDDILTVISRICACHNIRLAAENRSKMETFFVILIAYIRELADSQKPNVDLMDKLARPLFDLVQNLDSVGKGDEADIVASHFRELLDTADTLLTKSLLKLSKSNGKKKLSSGMPSLGLVAILRLVLVLFPSTDLSHTVSTTALLLICRYLSECPISDGRSAATGLYLCETALDFVANCKPPRVIPEVLTFLVGALSNASETSAEGLAGWGMPGCDTLLLSLAGTNDLLPCTLSLSQCIGRSDGNVLFTKQSRTNAVHTIFGLLERSVDLYKNNGAFPELYENVSMRLVLLDALYTQQNVCEDIVKSAKAMLDSLNMILARFQVRDPLALQRHKAIAIATHMPRFSSAFQPGPNRDPNKERNEAKKLNYQYKRELKGARREVRKDNYFVANERLKERIANDKDRNSKLKAAINILEAQQQNSNAEARFKAKKKK